MEHPPERWGADEVTKFLDFVRDNQFATFANRHDIFGRYIDTDIGFRTLINDGLHHSKLWFSGFFVTEHIPPFSPLFPLHALLRS
ncbi:hypothetical protein WQE_28534 [Paraburkholderia hospita]|uniref:Uncharacterized protein n=1 Tax=Paraburkholderia hospita TaxID=169430 RepID=A0ABP2PIA9_9BURK|nr:hypothetical protein [Paraburkholderia hospita]EIM97506.1 hypothetical protein WQE_28534 [Paraburkholderia hospita]OUL92521.1 hypothetical protein CA602_03235 [Paraburkholderia hospita]